MRVEHLTRTGRPKAPALADEYVHDNAFWRGAAARISVCVPVHRHDVSGLMETLAGCESSGLAEIVLYDDGSGDADVLARLVMQAGHVNAAVRIVAAAANRGQAAARNAAMRHARTDWVLMLNADTMPDGPGFIDAYLDAIETATAPAVIAGGHSLKYAKADSDAALHRWQAATSACVSADVRRKAPGRYLFPSNVLVHRAVLEAYPFAETFAGLGWEDANWGLRVQGRFPIIHIDNTATLLGLDADAALMSKIARSGETFALMAARHPDAVAHLPLYHAAKRLQGLPARRGLTALARAAARSHALPFAVRGRALKAWRALIYAGALP